VRYHLADERKSRTCKFILASQSDGGEVFNVEGYFTVSVYDDGTPGEVFIEMGKSGHEMNGFANCWGIAISMLLQYGVHPKKLYDKFKLREFSPKGITTLAGVPIAKSVPDLVMRWMEYNLPPTKKTEEPTDQEWMKLVHEVDAQR
jgi:ribonucleoside-diphosphate reductase alpha chain